MIKKKNIFNVFIIFLIFHLVIWTLIPTLSNENLPLDTIEALAWGSDLDWGFDKHPPLSAIIVEFVYSIFGPRDWVYYLLSQIFVIVAFIYVWKFSKEIFDEKIYSLISLFIIEGIYFYNFTTPEFNVNVCQLPFWALTVYYFWRSTNSNKILDWSLFGVFSALGFLSKYLFIYLLLAIFFYFFYNLKKNKRMISKYFFSIFISLLILTPHLKWLIENNFVTILYGLDRTGLEDSNFKDHIINPTLFVLKQIGILSPVFIMIFLLMKKIKIKFSLKNKQTLFLIIINIIPLVLMFATTILTGAKIRTMWMTPFYLFFGILLIDLFKKNILLNNLKKFYLTFLFFLILSPTLYLSISLLDETKRTDYPGKEITRLVQNKWDKNFINEIKIVVGDEWFAGNLSYHLYSRPIWMRSLENKTSTISENQGVVYVGNPKILKKICPGVFGTIKPVGYCMIGVK
ncbi:glycosyltransferase family 39 protein [Pelagibacteraceae bacterium]|nr:glycosyltransferase family 39 protein [Pelagibacteraceae bacterium]